MAGVDAITRDSSNCMSNEAATPTAIAAGSFAPTPEVRSGSSIRSRS